MDKFNLIYEKMSTEKPLNEEKVYEGDIAKISEDYSKDTVKFIDDQLKTADDKVKKFLNGLKDFVKENGFLTPEQRKGLASVTSSEK